jgi:hypothetical protein
LRPWTGVDFLAGGSAALIAPAAAQGRPAMARLSVDYENAGRTIARDFIGSSYESAVVAANDFFTADNRTLLRLLRTPAVRACCASVAIPANARYGGRRTPRRHARISSSRRPRSIA